MPLVSHRFLQPEGELGLWMIAEKEAYFTKHLELSNLERIQLNAIKGHRRMEWLAARWLLHLMSGREMRGACLKDEYGKPYLANSAFDISISHCRELAAVIAAPKLVGVDIQKIVPKILRIQEKFMHPKELAAIEEDTKIEQLHVYWGAKEALYKAYGRRQIDFKKHLSIKSFTYKNGKASTVGQVNKGDFQKSFEIYYEMLDEYMLVYALEDEGDQRLV